MKAGSLCCLSLGAAAAILGSHHREWDAIVQPSAQVSSANETHGSASLMGQFRTSVSGWLYLRTDLYLHNGVEMRPLSEAELGAGRMGVGSAEDGPDRLLDESALVTAIPEADRDFRGWIGDLERATATVEDMRKHEHRDPIATLPLFGLMTSVDPAFIRGWTMGATIHARADASGEAAMEFIRKGLRANPNDPQLLTQLGYYLLTRRKELEAGVQALERARRGAAERPILSQDEADSLLETYRWLALAYQKLGRRNLLRSSSAEGLERYPGDPVLERARASLAPIILTPNPSRTAAAKDAGPQHEPEHDHNHEP